MDAELYADRRDMVNDAADGSSASVRRRARAHSLRRRQRLSLGHAGETGSKHVRSPRRTPSRVPNTKPSLLETRLSIWKTKLSALKTKIPVPKKKLSLLKWSLVFVFAIVLGLMAYSLIPGNYIFDELMCSRPTYYSQTASCWPTKPQAHPHFDWVGQGDEMYTLAYKSSVRRVARPDQIRRAHSKLKLLVHLLSRGDPSKMTEENTLIIESNGKVNNVINSMHLTAAKVEHLLGGAILTHATPAAALKRIETRLRSSTNSHFLPGSQRRLEDATKEEIQAIFTSYSARMVEYIEEVMASYNTTLDSIVELQDSIPQMMSIFSAVPPQPRREPTAALYVKLADGTVQTEHDRQNLYWHAVLAPYEANITDFDLTVLDCASFSVHLIEDVELNRVIYDVLRRARDAILDYSYGTVVRKWKPTEETLALTVDMLDERIRHLEGERAALKMLKERNLERYERDLEVDKKQAAERRKNLEKEAKKKARVERGWIGYLY